MNEEKSITKYEEKTGIFQWIKMKINKFKNVFKTKSSMQKINKEEKNDELTEEELDEVKAGIIIREVDKEELMADLGMNNNDSETKSWELTEEELDEVKAGIPVREVGIEELMEDLGIVEKDEDKEPTI